MILASDWPMQRILTSIDQDKEAETSDKFAQVQRRRHWTFLRYSAASDWSICEYSALIGQFVRMLGSDWSICENAWL